ncbi:MAG TPA: hypothetical protein VI541_00770 [Actinomycetota bacterium]|nr:hypothetical protein [Actinomycetota bacterium]
MRAWRWLAAVFSVVGWVYAWYMFRGFRNAFARDEIPMPPWLLIAMGLATTLLIATAVLIFMRSALWPRIAVVAGPVYLASLVIGQFAYMRGIFSSVTIKEAFDTLFSGGGLAKVAFVVGVSLVLVLSGLTALIHREAT